MSRPGNPWDNALAESSFKAFKLELVNSKGYKTRGAKQDVFKCIELYRNRRRMRSSIGYSALCDLERDAARRSLLFRPGNLDCSKGWMYDRHKETSASSCPYVACRLGHPSLLCAA